MGSDPIIKNMYHFIRTLSSNSNIRVLLYTVCNFIRQSLIAYCPFNVSVIYSVNNVHVDLLSVIFYEWMEN